METTLHPSPITRSPIVELRRYTLHPGQRDTLIELFEREFIESQEAVGIELIGLFRDLDDPDAFVWLRGFLDMQTRWQALTAFYGGPVWNAHREAANATMIDSDNVRLLRPAFTDPAAAPSVHAAVASSQQMLVAVLWPLETSTGAASPGVSEPVPVPLLTATGSAFLGGFVTEPSTNTFPQLPVREGENVFVALWILPDATTSTEEIAALLRSGSSHEHRGKTPPLSFEDKAVVWRLLPTRRSRLR